jgi:hypothetical protein
MAKILQSSRYTTLRILIDAGRLNTLREILDYIPIDVLAADLNDDAGRLHDLFHNTKDIVMDEINAWAELIDCDFEKMAMLVAKQHLVDKGN